VGMERIWAGIRFAACGSGWEAFLTAAVDQGCALRRIRPLTDGFSAECSARRYKTLHSLAGRLGVRLKTEKRQGLYFCLRPVLRRKGLWAGILAGSVLVLFLQKWVWWICPVGVTTAQQLRMQKTLRGCGIYVGCHVTQALLSQGEFALMRDTDDYAWVSLNFQRGRLTVETAPSKEVPSIAESANVGPLLAKADGMITAIYPQDGTVVAKVGQQVKKRDILIEPSREDRMGQQHTRRAEGSVLAVVDWSAQAEIPLVLQGDYLTGASSSEFSLLRDTAAADDRAETHSYYWQAELLGLALPMTIEERVVFQTAPQTITRSEALARQLAEQQCRAQLHQQFPGCRILFWQPQIEIKDKVLYYCAAAQIEAEIGARNSDQGM